MAEKKKSDIKVTCYDVNGKQVNPEEIVLPSEIARRAIQSINYGR